MTTDYLKSVAESNQWWALGPEIMLACAALGLLVMEIILPKKDHRFIPFVAIVAQAMVLLTVIFNFQTIWLGENLFGGLIKLSPWGQVARVFFLVSSLLVSFLGTICLPRTKLPRVEFYHIVM
ncbi:MAG: NADH-quinone oxidoreductase subunit N, partial [Opitutaceae bacterium]